MQQKKDIQHVYLVGAKSLGAYGGYETFVYKLIEGHFDSGSCFWSLDWWQVIEGA